MKNITHQIDTLELLSDIADLSREYCDSGEFSNEKLPAFVLIVKYMCQCYPDDNLLTGTYHFILDELPLTNYKQANNLAKQLNRRYNRAVIILLNDMDSL